MSALSPEWSGVPVWFGNEDQLLNRKISDRRRWPHRNGVASRADAHFRTLVFDQIAYCNSRQGHSLRR
jgi:hypothetical protein